jgi:hypothetical protein
MPTSASERRRTPNEDAEGGCPGREGHPRTRCESSVPLCHAKEGDAVRAKRRYARSCRAP